MPWKVYLYGIEWDEGNPADGNDASELPENLEVTIGDHLAEDENQAIEAALAEATDEFGFLVQGTEQINVSHV